MDIIGFIDCYAKLGVKKDSTKEEIVTNYLEVLRHIRKKLNSGLSENQKKLIQKEKKDLDISFIFLTTSEIKRAYDVIYDDRNEAANKAHTKKDTRYNYSVAKKEANGKFTKLFDTYKDAITIQYNMLNKDNFTLSDVDLADIKSLRYKK